jgi:5-methyltetrahydrofolate--homocysteine methyltransferase
MEKILERLRRREVIVGDGAVGTLLMHRVLNYCDPPEAYNITRPNLLEEIASMYLEAGAEIITTNSLGASPLRLRQFCLEEQTETINQNAVMAVRRAVGDRAYISASVGPSGCVLKPLGKTDPDEVLASFSRQISALLSASADLICIETMTDIAEATLALQAVRSLNPSIPVMATMTFSKSPRGYYTFMGTSVPEAVTALEKAGADIIGSNCGEGSDNMLAIAREFCRYSHVPVAIQSNAGLPSATNEGVVYPETPEFMAARAAEMVRLGVQVIGGCCGTTPEHIRAIRKAVSR